MSRMTHLILPIKNVITSSFFIVEKKIKKAFSMFFQALSNENDGNAVASNSFFCNVPLP